ncbi:hypothetical protein [Streptomyces albidoflavus]|uniref:Integral membrane protein n=1 Tax=Streptomyces albidoflavus TaxID=1886 RepID=A0AB37XB97_9ACTN|nr:hypothetical protein [Streptomyces albidoflavus]RZE37597.1 hypothetical protein C0Q91_18795 [Streptomyces albidoflavus]
MTRASYRLLGWARLRAALLTAVLAATLITLFTSLPAHADPPWPSPTPTAPAPATPSTPTEEELAEIQEILDAQAETRSKAEQQAAMEAEAEKLRKALPDEGGVLGVFNVTDVNNLPISVYRVKGDTGGFTRWDLGLLNLGTEFLFTVTKWMIAFSCWLIGWALSFGLAKLLLGPVLAVAESLHARVIMEMGLPALFLAVCAFVCAARIFFGNRARGIADAVVSLILAALTTTLLASPPQLLLGEETGAVAAARGLSLEIADVILDASPTAPWADGKDTTTEATSFTVARPLTDALTDAFIVKPAMLLTYGRVFDGECEQLYADYRLRQLVFDRQLAAQTARMKKTTHLADYVTPDDTLSAVGDWHIDMATNLVSGLFGDTPMEDFEDQCIEGDVAAAKEASLDKLGGALFLFIAAGIVTALITRIGASFLTAQVRIAWDAVRAEPCLVAGTIPGIGRTILRDWAAAVLRHLATMVVSVASLALLILVLQAVLDPAQTDWGNELTLRFLAVDIICLAAFVKRKSLAQRTNRAVNNMVTRHGSGPGGGDDDRQIGRAAARGAVRGTFAVAALARGRPGVALSYAMPRTIGSTALMSRLSRKNSGPKAPALSRSQRRAWRKAQRPSTATPPASTTSTPSSTSTTSTAPARRRNRPPHSRTSPSSAKQQRLRTRLHRAKNRAVPPRKPSTHPKNRKPGSKTSTSKATKPRRFGPFRKKKKKP